MTSTNRTGSQKEIGTPTGKNGRGQVQNNWRVLGVSSPLAETLRPAIVIGNKQLQQMSVSGLTNLPTHLLQIWVGNSK